MALRNAFAIAIHCAKPELGPGKPLLGGKAKPLCCFRVILRNTLPEIIPLAKIKLSGGISPLGPLAGKPHSKLCRVVSTMQERFFLDFAQGLLRFDMPLRGGTTIPFERFRGILRNKQSHSIRQAEIVLRVGIAPLSLRMEGSDVFRLLLQNAQTLLPHEGGRAALVDSQLAVGESPRRIFSGENGNGEQDGENQQNGDTGKSGVQQKGQELGHGTLSVGEKDFQIVMWP